MKRIQRYPIAELAISLVAQLPGQVIWFHSKGGLLMLATFNCPPAANDDQVQP